ncbi:MAG: SEL1-like repeat protein [Bacteroidaceae bacterium]|nr:SEL1-like repeat protein [Bacteroidaceae bacterium]
MAKLVTKFKYLKPNAPHSVGGYAKYIGTREGVEKIDDTFKLAPATGNQKKLINRILKDFPDSREMLEYADYLSQQTAGAASEFISRAVEDNADEMVGSKTYADYIATRPGAERHGAHGLFTKSGEIVQLSKVSEELNAHEGNVWTLIISLRREDAQRLGFDKGSRWREMLRGQEQAISDALGIPMVELKWYAAFHDASHHPHIHLIAYSSQPKKGYLNKDGVHKLRASFAKDIFQQDFASIFEKQMEYRNTLRHESRELIAKIVAQINSGVYHNPVVEAKLVELADRLSKTKGKKQYGYLKSDVKAIVDSIVDALAEDERIQSLYDLWYEKRDAIIRIYTDEPSERVSLTDNKEFKTIKNAVIQEALNIMADRTPIEDMDDTAVTVAEPTEPTELPVSDSDTEAPPPSDTGERKRTWWSGEYKWARVYLYGNARNPVDLEKAFQLMEKQANSGNGFAMFDFGKMYAAGLGCQQSDEIAQRWYTSALRAFLLEEPAIRKPSYLQYRIGKMYAMGCGTQRDLTAAAQWYMKADAGGNPFAAYALGSMYLRGEGVERDPERAYRYFEKAAEDPSKPNAYAAYELGRMCEEGIGTEVDPDMADYWYSAAYDGFLEIEKGHADDRLYYRLGQMNLSGTGTEVDLEKAQAYFLKAANLHNPDALYGLGKLYHDKTYEHYDTKTAVGYLIDAARKGHDFAQYTLGRLFLKGTDVPQNVSYALRWLEEAVKNENSFAEYLLGRTLLLGEDVERDPERGAALLRKSAESGNATACYVFGKALLEGKLLRKNTPKAIHFITEAAERNFSAAQYLIGKLLYEGKYVPKDLNRAVAYLEQATMRGNSYAAYLSGKILLKEETVRDPARAIRCFEKAAQIGNDYAEYQLGKIYLQGDGVPQDHERAIAYLSAASAHGNQYATQLLHSIEENRNWAVSVGSLRLLHHMGRLLKNQLEDDRKVLSSMAADRKIRQKEEEKKQRHGLKHG